MDTRRLAIDGAWEMTPRRFADDRGYFLEWFTDGAFGAASGHALDLRQANLSVSRTGVVRGVHFADVPPGQAKYVTCPSGAVVDVVVDIRVGSPTFGRWDSVLLDDQTHRAVYLAEGLGHAFVALEERSTVVYLCSATYNPAGEHGIDPLDPELAIPWADLDPRLAGHELVLSEKDTAAPRLAQARAAGLLPTWDEVSAYVRSLQENPDERTSR